MNKTIVVQIGNSDNKLTQNEWSHFHAFVNAVIMEHSCQMHFSGASNPLAPWQNAAWVFTIEEQSAGWLQEELKAYARIYRQDSIAWTEGDTVFLAAATPDDPADLMPCGHHKKHLHSSAEGASYCQACEDEIPF